MRFFAGMHVPRWHVNTTPSNTIFSREYQHFACWLKMFFWIRVEKFMLSVRLVLEICGIKVVVSFNFALSAPHVKRRVKSCEPSAAAATNEHCVQHHYVEKVRAIMVQLGDLNVHVNTLMPIQNGRHFLDDMFKCIFLNENVWLSIKMSLKFVPEGPINYIPALVQIMAWRRPGDKPLSEPMLFSLLTHLCVTRPQWGNFLSKLAPRHRHWKEFVRYFG